MKRILLLLLFIPCVFALDVPQPTGFVVDTAGMFENPTAISEYAASLERETTVEVAVLTIPSLEGEVLEEYATRVFREWGVGKADKNNGVLILIAEEEREIRIEVGTGLEGTIPDSIAGRIIRNRMTPHFKEERYQDGIMFALQDIAGLVLGNPEVVSAYRTTPPRTSLVAIISFFVAYAILMGLTQFFISEKKKRHKVRNGFLLVMLMGAYLIMSVVGSSIFWFILIMLMMFSITGTGGFMFFGGGLGGGGRGGFGGFGGGFSGGGGASGGW